MGMGTMTIKEMVVLVGALACGGLYVVDVFGVYNVSQHIPDGVLNTVPVGGPSLIIGLGILLLVLSVVFTYRRISRTMILPDGARN